MLLLYLIEWHLSGVSFKSIDFKSHQDTTAYSKSEEWKLVRSYGVLEVRKVRREEQEEK